MNLRGSGGSQLPGGDGGGALDPAATAPDPVGDIAQVDREQVFVEQEVEAHDHADRGMK